MTPRYLNALLKRRENNRHRDEFMIAQLTSWVANTGFRTTDKALSPQDFMIGTPTGRPRRKRKIKKERAAAQDEIRAYFRAFAKQPNRK